MPRATVTAAVLAASLVCSAARGAEQTALADLSLEQLRDVRVVTVSRFEERLDRAAASVYVIGADDIRRSGATTLAQALRLAPNLDIARADANQYAISARGFTNVLANKMLVLIDGRTVYTPLFSGVFWEAQDVALQDVERIEVISGPATALWGSNAVNGLIHVITRPAGETRGVAAGLSAGGRERTGEARWGTSLGPDAALRLYAKGYDRDTTRRADGSPVFDQADGVQAGFRADWTQAAQRLTLQGDAYRGTIDPAASARRFSGANLVARLERGSADGSTLTLQAYADQTKREHPQVFRKSLLTLDLLAQYAFDPRPGHRLLLGAGHRQADDDLTTFAALAFVPPDRRLRWSRVFVQDQFALAPNLAATLAASFERNPYTGGEWLPSARLAWQPQPSTTLWAALSRAVRAPSRIDREFFQPAQPPHLIAGGPDFDAEVSTTFELGWRAQPTSALSLSASAFHARYDRLRSAAPTPAGLQFRNDIEGRVRGLEAWGRWHALPRWRLDAGAVLQRQRLEVRAGAVDVGGLQALGNDPRHWLSLRSALELTRGWSWDLALRRVGARPLPEVPAYTAVGTRLAWRPAGRPEFELALVVDNLFDRRHPEWGPAGNRVELERSAALQLRWRH